MLDFTSNEMANNNYGLYLDNEIPPQDNKGNLWTGTPNAAKFHTTGMLAQDIADASKFRVNSSVNPAMRPENIYPSEVEDFWFEENGFGNASCASSPTCGVPPPTTDGAGGNTPIDKECEKFAKYIEALESPKINGKYFHQYTWVRDYYIYKHFESIPESTWRDCDDIRDFMDHNDRIKSYVKVDRGITNAYKPTDSQLSFIDYHSELITVALGEIEEIYNNMPEEYETFSPDIKVYQDVISESSTIIRDINTRIDQIGNTKLHDLVQDIQSLTVVHDFEEKLKVVWNAKIRVLLDGVAGLNQSEWLDIEYIANGCPDEDVLALYEARSLISLKDGVLHNYNDEGVCTYINPRSSKSKVDNIKVYPNPTSGLLTLEVNDETKGNLTIDVYAIDGVYKFKKSVAVVKDYVALNLSTFQNGMYILKFAIDGNFVSSQKIVVAK